MTFFIFLMVALFCICLGMILGSLFTVNQVSGIGSLLITIISIFSGAWMDLKLIGGVFETIGYALPFAYAVDVSRSLLEGSSFSGVSNGFFIIVFSTVISFVLAILSFRRAMRKI